MKNETEGNFPPGWDEERVRRVLEHCESQSEEEAVAEDEAGFEASAGTLMAIPPALVPEVRRAHQPLRAGAQGQLRYGRRRLLSPR